MNTLVIGQQLKLLSQRGGKLTHVMQEMRKICIKTVLTRVFHSMIRTVFVDSSQGFNVEPLFVGLLGRWRRVMRKAIFIVMPVLVLMSGLCVAIGQGVHTWYGNEEFMNQLDASITSFFGNTVGTYLPSGSVAYSNADVHTDSMTYKTKISNQFLAIFGHGVPGMQQLLNQETLYEYNAGPQDGLLRVAIVTPQYSTKVLAAAMVHYSCGHLSHLDVNNTSKIEANFAGTCQQPMVTIFFQDQASRNSIIESELTKWGTIPLLTMCHHDMVHTQNSWYHRAYVARHGHQPPPCHAMSHVVLLNQ
ncbi:MAG: hypothetical protein ACRDHZ_16465 [Ktedonobacteraceae bacterium]